jgi:hypothetical protein
MRHSISSGGKRRTYRCCTARAQMALHPRRVLAHQAETLSRIGHQTHKSRSPRQCSLSQIRSSPHIVRAAMGYSTHPSGPRDANIRGIRPSFLSPPHRSKRSRGLTQCPSPLPMPSTPFHAPAMRCPSLGWRQAGPRPSVLAMTRCARQHLGSKRGGGLQRVL